jgi:hypothetical protein
MYNKYIGTETSVRKPTWKTRRTYGLILTYMLNIQIVVPYFLIDNVHLMYNAHSKLFRHSF